MGTDAPTIADLHRDPLAVASRLNAWLRGDRAEAVTACLDASARTMYSRGYTLWVWVGTAPGGTPAWLIPVRAAEVERFAPAGPMVVLGRCIRAAADCGAVPATIGLLEWDGYTGIVAPGAELTLGGLAFPEAHPAPARVAIAPLPDGIVVDGPPLDFDTVPAAGRGGLDRLAQATRTHPVLIARELVAQGWRLDEPRYPDDVVDLLRHRGFDGPPAPRDAPNFAIRDDPCPRRRHARLVLRRLLHKRKIGSQYHTEFDHLARGAPPEDRADALAVGEALIRSGLLGEKPSVGQRHVYLRRDALPGIHALIDRGETMDAELASEWTAPAPGDSPGA